MEKIDPGPLKAWRMLSRFQFFPLTIILVSLGTAIASCEGYFHFGHFLLAMFGSILVHMTVLVVHDDHDCADGMDPFLGHRLFEFLEIRHED